MSRTDDGPLLGGTANFGRIIRFGDTVHRPVGSHTTAVHALLRHLEAAGFDRVPRVIGVDGEHEVVGYLEGRAGERPMAPWSLGETVIVGVGELLRSYHDAAEGFEPRGYRWQRELPLRWRGNLVTHNDLNPANVIFRDGAPVAMIDFDLAAPGCAAFDLAVTACFWVPLLDDRDVSDSRRGNELRRLRALLDGYRAGPVLRREVVSAMPAANGWIADVIEDNARRGHPAFGRLWQQAMGVHRRAADWLSAHAQELSEASR